jgi:hypothetical protein
MPDPLAAHGRPAAGGKARAKRGKRNEKEKRENQNTEDTEKIPGGD